jgi:hypothetical protein
MTDNTELRELSLLSNYDTLVPHNQNSYEQSKPLYEATWTDESNTDPSYDNPWSSREYDTTQEALPVHLESSSLPLYDIVQSNSNLLFQPAEDCSKTISHDISEFTSKIV